MSAPRLLHNIATLGFLQVASVVLTLVTLPYLTRVLGVETWGRVVFVQLVVNYLLWMCNWGFYLSSTRTVAANRNNPAILADVYAATLAAQWMFTVVAILALIALFSYVPLFSKDRTLYMFGIGLLVGNALTPLWFLNGMERIREAAIIQIMAKALAVPLFFIFVRTSEDASVFIGINAGCAILMGVITLSWIRRYFLHSYSIPGWKNMYLQIKEGAALFAASAWANLGGALAPTILGSIAGPTELGYYNIADRVKGAGVTVLQPITHALFPRMCRLFALDSRDAETMLKRFGAVVIGGAAVISLAIFLSAPHIVRMLGGRDFMPASGVLERLALVPFLITLSSFCTHQIIIPARRSGAYHSITLAGLCVTAILIVPAVKWRGAQGAAILTLGTEMLVAMIALMYVLRNSLLFTTRIP